MLFSLPASQFFQNLTHQLQSYNRITTDHNFKTGIYLPTLKIIYFLVDNYYHYLHHKVISVTSKLSHYRVLEDLQRIDTMTDPKPGMNTGIPIKDANKYHWWYDSKAAGVRNSPPMGMMGTSPTGSPPNAFNFMSTSPASASGINPAATKRRDSLKNMVHLCDFATP